MSERRKAAEVVAAVIGGASLADALPPQLAGLEGRDRALVQELAFGTVRWMPRLEAWMDHLLERKPNNPYIHALLAVGLYQVFFTRIPPHAAVSETVAAAPQKMRGLCNAVLRNADRKRAELEVITRDNAVASSAHPEWLLRRIQQDWPNDWQAIIEANNTPAPMTLRVNRTRTGREDYLARLAAAGIPARAASHAADGIQLEGAVAVTQLPGFAEGDVSVQDAAAQLAADVMDVQDGMRVLDACAAPGGKTCHLLERTPDLAELVAVEIDSKRLQRVKENLDRLGLEATLVCGDAANPADWWDGKPFDRILLDAPCSATGVIRRHPDIRLLRRASDLAEMARQQREMVSAMLPLLAPGGRLVYATCSVLPVENDGVVGVFNVLPFQGGWGRTTEHGRQVLPGQDDMDGFYYACLVQETA